MDLVLLLASAVDPVPEAEDVRAGWGAFWLFVALVAATALLMWSFVRQIRKTQANAERGVFGPVERPEEHPEEEARVEQGDETRG